MNDPPTRPTPFDPTLPVASDSSRDLVMTALALGRTAEAVGRAEISTFLAWLSSLSNCDSQRKDRPEIRIVHF